MRREDRGPMFFFFLSFFGSFASRFGGKVTEKLEGNLCHCECFVGCSLEMAAVSLLVSGPVLFFFFSAFLCLFLQGARTV